jgi:hypothetical protein
MERRQTVAEKGAIRNAGPDGELAKITAPFGLFRMTPRAMASFLI